MFRKKKVAVACAAVAALAACADGTVQRARVTEPEVSADFVSVAASCTNSAFSGYKKSAQAYSSQRNDPVGDLFGVLQKASSASAKQAAALDILARLDVIRSTGLSKAAIDGAKAAVAAIGCGLLGQPPGDANMALAMELTPGGGVFEVVGGPADTRTGAAIAPQATVKWGAEPYDQGNSGVPTWGQIFPSRVLLYAYRLSSVGNFGGIPLTSEAVAFEMSTFPFTNPAQVNGKNALDIFVCAGDDDSRIQSSANVLTPWMPRYCANPAGTGVVSNPAPEAGNFGSRVLAWLSPKPLHAALFLGGTGGMPSGWSPKGLVDVDVSALSLTIGPVADMRVGTLTMTARAWVKAVDALGQPINDANGVQILYPIGDIDVRILVAGNNGLGNDGTIPSGTWVKTGDDGVASPTIFLDKTGSYTLSVEARFGTTTFASILTNQFNVRP